MKLKSELYIGAVMLDADTFIKYPVPYDAIVPELQELYIEIQKRVLEGKPVEPLDIWLDHKGEKWCNHVELVRIYTNAVTPYKAKHYAESLMKDYRREKFKSWVQTAQALVEGDDIEKAEAELIKLYEENYTAPYLSIADINKTIGEETLPRIYTGNHILDNNWILDKGGLHIVAGRPAMGKSSFVIWIMSQVVPDVPVLFLSLEMPNAQIMRKLKLDLNMPLFISDVPSQTIEAILLKSQLARRHKNIGLVVIDYIQLIRTQDKFQNRERQISHISSTLKQMAKQLNIPVLACSQLNRQAEITSEKRPSLANLRESGSIEQDCDSAVLLYRPEYYYKMAGKEVPHDQKNLCQVIIAKQRNAPVGELLVNWYPDTNIWEDWRKYGYQKSETTEGQL